MTNNLEHLSRRERQIMDIVYACGEASVNQVVGQIPDPPSRTAVRTMLRILEEKGHLKHRKTGREFIYAPTRPRQRVGLSALNRVIDTFYNGSLEDAVAAQLFESQSKLSTEQLKRLDDLIQQAKAQGR
ncbi:MAG: BlaI/MecI/CopY family transcriptional regulator [Pirellulaceae bacterium]|jgi:predicted transcriptional regulator|nr:BlaI/MecI/CopY family transcriptional regulator [Pirellulaceae bacterium]MDP7017172.1 BlaI/MecI/CopY family transcriptional regulator [Pirellulaceae bacterium]